MFLKNQRYLFYSSFFLLIFAHRINILYQTKIASEEAKIIQIQYTHYGLVLALAVFLSDSQKVRVNKINAVRIRQAPLSKKKPPEKFSRGFFIYCGLRVTAY